MFGTAICALGFGERFPVYPIERVVYSLFRAANGEYRVLYDVPKFVDRRVIEMMNLLAEFGKKLRTCSAEEGGCGRWFLTTRSDQEYCSRTCTSRATVRRFRERLAQKKERGKKHAKR